MIRIINIFATDRSYNNEFVFKIKNHAQTFVFDNRSHGWREETVVV